MTDRSSSGRLEMTTSKQDFKLPLKIQDGKDTRWLNPAVSSRYLSRSPALPAISVGIYEVCVAFISPSNRNSMNGIV